MHQLDAPNFVKAGEGGRNVMPVCTGLVPCNQCPYGSVIKLTAQYYRGVNKASGESSISAHQQPLVTHTYN